MSKCDVKLSIDKLENFVQLSKSIEQSLELAKRGTEQIKTELNLLKQIHNFHAEYDLLSHALKASPRTRSENSAFKKELFSLVRKRIHLLRAFHKHCEEFKSDMKSMRQLQTYNDLEYESSDDENCFEDMDIANGTTLRAIQSAEESDDESGGIVLHPTSSPTTYV